MRKSIEIQDLRPGTGPTAGRGHAVTIYYTGFLNRGDKFQENITVTFRVGSREVIAGLSHGVEGMRVGGLRRVRVGPHLAYGSAGVPGVIPANAVLTFEVELLAVVDTEQQKRKIAEMERQHAEGYARYPVEPGEFDIWETEQAWGEA
ncbi:MAG: FKBP-type peptidyl-prolyl cis-trans isomerase [Anaerolineales bacterium]|nr:FKBP-type peptidyl-prolyl cis-trans isomerase [Anaerolineales bacterium]